MRREKWYMRSRLISISQCRNRKSKLNKRNSLSSSKPNPTITKEFKKPWLESKTR